MAELNLKQIIDRLNAEFMGNNRKLVFWYDDKGEFIEDMKSVVLDNAKIYFLQPDNQFYTKYFLECKDTTTNYLIYAPFPKPDVKDNHLEDTMLYSQRFFADRASLLSLDLGIEEKYKPIIEKHIKFFAEKERTQRFYNLEIENFNEENILTGLLSAICRTRTCSFEEVVRVILTEADLTDNKFLEEINKYDLLESFWKLCERQFGYTDVKPTLEKLLITMFVTYTDKYIPAQLPKAWKPFVSYKSGNIIAFLDNLMNSILYREKYDELSNYIASSLNVSKVFDEYLPETLLDCDTFLVIDQIIVKWVIERLLTEDTGACLDGLMIPQICGKRMKMHFSDCTKKVYQLLGSAYHLIMAADYHCPDAFKLIIEQYQTEDCLLDQEYRQFYYCYDQIEHTEEYESLRDLIENIYTNEYLAKLLPKWNAAIQQEDALSALPLQRNFYKKYVESIKERTAVIISDAMRYEVGRELFYRLQEDPKCMTKLETMLGVLPSYTRLGMAALLPHRTLTMTDDYKILADDILCNDLASRQKVLQSHDVNGVCVKFDDIKALKQDELRDIFTGKQVIYIYHNQIDARGDKPETENEVFVACAEAIREITDLMHRISARANTHRFIVTADHGFIYKRDKIMESDKIGGGNDKQAFVNRRFIVAQAPVVGDGITSMNMGHLLNNNDSKVVSYPTSSHVFKVPGGGLNYVHGGSSPQEMMIPVLDIKMARGHKETRNAQITLVSMVHKITNLITTMEFIQSDFVGNTVNEVTVKAATYKIFFISEDNEKISNENIYMADNRNDDSSDRIFRMRFTFKNKRYDKDKQYYLVIYDAETGVETFRHPVIMDLAFADDFGFDM